MKPVTGSQGEERATRSHAPSAGRIFHEHWWLEAVTGGTYAEVYSYGNGRQVGRLPYFITKKMGLRVGQMPPFTRILGPVVEPMRGKPQTQLRRRLSIVRELVEQLPECHLFWFALDSHSVDALALQDRGFELSVQNMFEIDCRSPLEGLFEAMHIKARQPLRRAQEKFSVNVVRDPYQFIHYYLQNLAKVGARNRLDWSKFPALFEACQAKESGEILSATWPDGRHAAMVFLVWDHGKMYYLLATRTREEGAVGSANLLIWEGMKRAHARGLVFDLDCITTDGATTFLSGFNGVPKMRIFARRASLGYNLVHLAKRHLICNPLRGHSSKRERRNVGLA